MPLPPMTESIRHPMAVLLTGLLFAGLLGACASRSGLEVEGDLLELYPDQVLQSAPDLSGQVLWGGEIVAVDNLEQETAVEILAYPLSRYSHQPQYRDEPVGRFVAYYPRFLEPVTYAPGRFVSLTGLLQGREIGLVGDYEYEFPVVYVDQLHLWPADPQEWRSNVRFGVGVGVHL